MKSLESNIPQEPGDQVLRCTCWHCGYQYEIPFTLSTRAKHLRDDSITYAHCSNCGAPRMLDIMRSEWGKPRCWLCRVPLDKTKNNQNGLCSLHNLMLWKFRGISSDPPISYTDPMTPEKAGTTDAHG